MPTVTDLGKYLGCPYSPIVYYQMQTTLLPRGIFDQIDRALRNFLWGDTASQNHIHLILGPIRYLIQGPLIFSKKEKNSTSSQATRNWPHSSSCYHWKQSLGSLLYQYAIAYGNYHFYSSHSLILYTIKRSPRSILIWRHHSGIC